jgi:hypothetical protein
MLLLSMRQRCDKDAFAQMDYKRNEMDNFPRGNFFLIIKNLIVLYH